jgi:hypothetical protein
MLKLRAPLVALLQDASALLPGKVRPEAAEGLRRLAGLRSVQWARQADQGCMYPTAEQVGCYMNL